MARYISPTVLKWRTPSKNFRRRRLDNESHEKLELYIVILHKKRERKYQQVQPGEQHEEGLETVPNTPVLFSIAPEVRLEKEDVTVAPKSSSLRRPQDITVNKREVVQETPTTFSEPPRSSDGKARERNTGDFKEMPVSWSKHPFEVAQQQPDASAGASKSGTSSTLPHAASPSASPAPQFSQQRSFNSWPQSSWPEFPSQEQHHILANPVSQQQHGQDDEEMIDSLQDAPSGVLSNSVEYWQGSLPLSSQPTFQSLSSTQQHQNPPPQNQQPAPVHSFFVPTPVAGYTSSGVCNTLPFAIGSSIPQGHKTQSPTYNASGVCNSLPCSITATQPPVYQPPNVYAPQQYPAYSVFPPPQPAFNYHSNVDAPSLHPTYSFNPQPTFAPPQYMFNIRRSSPPPPPLPPPPQPKQKPVVQPFIHTPSVSELLDENPPIDSISHFANLESSAKRYPMGRNAVPPGVLRAAYDHFPSDSGSRYTNSQIEAEMARMAFAHQKKCRAELEYIEMMKCKRERLELEEDRGEEKLRRARKRKRRKEKEKRAQEAEQKVEEREEVADIAPSVVTGSVFDWLLDKWNRFSW